MCHLSLPAECELHCVRLHVCVYHSVTFTARRPVTLLLCSNTSTHRGDRTHRESGAMKAHSGACAYWGSMCATCVPARTHESSCTRARRHVRRGPGVCLGLKIEQSWCSKGTLVMPLTRVNLPCLVLKLSTWWMCRPSPHTFWPYKHLNFPSYQ